MRRLLLPFAVLLLVSGQTPAPPPTGTVTGAVGMDRKGTPIANPKDVWVFLVDVTRPRTRLVRDWTTTIVQKKSRRFEPKVLVVPAGATVGFPNEDREDHNVFTPARGDDPQWDGGRYGPKKSASRIFNDVDEYAIYCDLHKEMSATIKVVPSRYFVDVKNGTFTIPSVPPGRYKVVAWAPGSDEVKSDVIEVKAGTTTPVPPLNVHWGALDTVHLRADGSPYKKY
jgi:plastocyanin